MNDNGDFTNMEMVGIGDSADFTAWQEEVAAQGCSSPYEFEDVEKVLPAMFFWAVVAGELVYAVVPFPRRIP